MQTLGAQIGTLCRGGEVIELDGDIGAGKTTFTKGLARSMGVTDDVQSPTFTISRVYDAPSGLRLAHYDFYRLTNAGVMSMELTEAMADAQTVTVVEWAAVVSDVLPDDVLRITIASTVDEGSRTVDLTASGERGRRLIEGVGK